MALLTASPHRYLGIDTNGARRIPIVGTWRCPQHLLGEDCHRKHHSDRREQQPLRLVPVWLPAAAHLATGARTAWWACMRHDSAVIGTARVRKPQARGAVPHAPSILRIVTEAVRHDALRSHDAGGTRAQFCSL